MKQEIDVSDAIHLRPMQSADLDTFLQLGTATCGSLHGRPNLSNTELRNHFRSFVKEFAFRTESEIWVVSTSYSNYMGHLWLYTSINRFNGNNELWVWDVSVMPEFRGKGLGKKLVQHAKLRAAELECQELWLLVAEENEIAKSLYASVGLSPRGQMLAIEI